jgi:choline-sulfatase
VPDDRPNVLLLFSDEHSYRCLGHGAPETVREPVSTPMLDDLAASGTVVTDTYCPVPLCTPSRIATLTGREQTRSGGWDSATASGAPVSTPHPDVPTLPGVFSNGGYETCLQGKMHLGGDRQFVGFDHRPYGDLTGIGGHQPEPIHPYDRGNGVRHGRFETGVTAIPESRLQERTIVEESLAWLREHRAARDAPWFLCASFSRPHFPLTAPERYLDRFWDRDADEPTDRLTEPPVGDDSDAAAHPSSGVSEDRSREETMRARAAYFACVEYLDEILGDFLVLLDREGFLDDTIVVYTSDHGEMAGEHGLWWKQTWQEASVRVPLTLQTPAQRRGDAPTRRIETPASMLDIFPTLCGLTGVDAPDGLDGTDLASAIETGNEPDRGPVYADMLMPRKGDEAHRVIRDGRWKYVGFRDRPELLFDLEHDPFETTNLAADPPSDEAAAVLDRLRAAFEDTVDFDALAERYERDAERLNEHAGGIAPGTSGNVFHLPDGRIVDADLSIYRPHVLSEAPADEFSDWPDGA